jgi:glycosidase
VSNDAVWWRDTVIYQLVVPSFFDTNSDGHGDLEGIIARLDYLEWLGVGAVWLSPIYSSPFHDLGYDVEDYCTVAPRFGSLEIFDRLLAEAHARGIRVILDWVPNHTSDRHPWFADSRASRDSAKRSWYIWRDGREDGSPPNNWQSVFGGSVWEWDEATRQFYLHTFLASQPDLNWREPAVADAMAAALRFWVARGVDGFRIDAADLMLKDEALRDNPPSPKILNSIKHSRSASSRHAVRRSRLAKGSTGHLRSRSPGAHCFSKGMAFVSPVRIADVEPSASAMPFFMMPKVVSATLRCPI